MRASVASLCRFLEYAILTDCCVMLAWAPFVAKSVLKVQVLAGFVFLLLYGIMSRRTRLQPLVPLNRTGFYLASFVCALLVSAAAGIDWYHSQKIIINRFGFYAGAFFLGCFCARTSGVRCVRTHAFFPAAISLSGLLLGIGAIVDYLAVPGKVYGAWNIGLNLAPFLAVYMPFLFVYAVTGNRVERTHALVALVALCPALLWHGSRGAWLAVGAACCVTACACQRRGVVAAVIGFTGVLSGLFLAVNRDRLIHMFNPQAWGNRVELWGSALNVFFDFPVLGAGPGLYEKLLYRYAPFGRYSEGGIHLHAHNTYLELMAETGMVGALLFVLVIIVFLRSAWLDMRDRSGRPQPLLLGVSGVVAAGAVLSLFCTVLIVGTQETAVFWFLFGAGTVLLKPGIQP